MRRTGPGISLAAVVCFGQAAAAAEIGDAERGEALFEQCSGCHQVGPDAVNRIGPVLNNVFGRPAASVEGFRYSTAFERAGAKGLEWHIDTLSAFLENPKAIVPRSRMSFRGIADPQERADLIAYLRTFSASPRDIPEADPTAPPTDHDVDPEILAIPGDAEYGAYLSSECTTCHQAEGGDEGIPSIVYWPEEDFVVAMHAYKSKAREHPVMNMIAGRLNDEEIAALAAYFAAPED
ncbi:c-type cytochrome [Psychromarinibacter sp. C21-152]|uniref:C-type cytochrome n=1 Tax=Psychromarinibacter sediminicola TaxID=3033385 RepID=A0AAE3T7R9_9RHOB|nr:c-type cytochrome [Psychromarinibacter sediminicola]MDF0600008.1 c-type cytochrome [Psychromarinibacter sediminicola]